MNNDLISRKALLEAYDKAHKGPPGGARKLMEDAPGGIIGEFKRAEVFFLPCKVGDLVYAMWSVPTNCKYIIYCAEVKEIRIAMRNCRVTTTYILEPIDYRGRREEYRDDDFGKLVFLTREKAEEALANMDGGKEK